MRIVASRGSMDVGESEGGLPPDDLVEEMDAVLADTEGLFALHEEGPGAWTQIAVAPCSPFSVSKRLMTESAALARRLGLRLHTHLAETVEEEEYCQGLFGCRPVEYLEQLGWLAGDVWCAHCVHLSDEDVRAFGAAGTGVAHCPTSNLRLGAGVAPVRAMIDAGVPVGLGVDGSASNERSDLAADVKQALLVARGRGGPGAMTVREALRLGTRGGADVLGRRDLGSLEPGKCADFAVWRWTASSSAAPTTCSGGARPLRPAPGGAGSTWAASRPCSTGRLDAEADEREVADRHGLRHRLVASGERRETRSWPLAGRWPFRSEGAEVVRAGRRRCHRRRQLSG